jgi:hypothetical protein
MSAVVIKVLDINAFVKIYKLSERDGSNGLSDKPGKAREGLSKKAEQAAKAARHAIK